MRNENIFSGRLMPIILMGLMLTVPFALVISPTGARSMNDGREGYSTMDAEELEGAFVDGFIENGGQWDDGIRFMTGTSFGHLGLGDGFIIFNVMRTEPGDNKEDPIVRGSVMRLVFEHPNVVRPIGREPGKYSSNFFIGKDQSRWSTDLNTYSEVVYPDLWDGIDLVYRCGDEGLKYEYICKPGSDPSEISFHIEGARTVEVNKDIIEIRALNGISLMDGNLRSFYKGFPYGNLDVTFSMSDGDSIGFEMPEYDESRSLVIDPFIFSTYIGGTQDESNVCMTTDADGNIYLAGPTPSFDFPVTAGAYSTRLCDQSDGFIMKMPPDGSSPLFSTFIGGSGWDEFRGIDVDTDTDVFVAGSTDSKDFPTTKGAYNETMNNCTAEFTADLVVVKLDSSGSQLCYSTYIGGTEWESMNDDDLIMVDSRSCAHVAAESMSGDFPVTKDAFDKYNNQTPMGWRNSKVVLFKLSTDGSDLVYSTYIGGEDWDSVSSLWLDDNGFVYLAGDTSSIDFPVTDGAFDTDLGWGDLYVLKFDISRSDVVYGTFLGGSEFQTMWDITVDGEGKAIVTGATMSADFPVTEDSYCTVHNGDDDVFVTAFDPTGSSLYFSTFIGGGNMEIGRSLFLDENGNILITGSTLSEDFPSSVGNKTPDGDEYDVDAFLTVLNRTGDDLLYSTIIGGCSPPRRSEDIGYSVLPVSDDRAIVAGTTGSSDFPLSEDCFDDRLGGMSDIFLLSTYLSTPPSVPLNIQIVQGDGYLNLSWETPMSDGGMPITDYTVFRGDREDGLKIYCEEVTGTHLVDAELDIGTTYFYAVRAENAMGSGAVSKIVSAKAVSSPSPPQHLTIEEEPGEITLSWIPPHFDGALPVQGYKLYKNTEGMMGFEVIEVPQHYLKFLDGNVEDGKNYSYYITAYNNIGESMVSDMVWAIPKGLPSSPLNLSALGGPGYVLLSWEYPGNDGGSTVTGYRVHQGIPMGEDIIWRYIETSETTFNDTLVEIGLTYRYYVTALNSEGESPPSPEVIGSPVSVPSSPEGVKVLEGDRYVVISWAQPSQLGGLDLLGYRIYAGEDGHGFSLIGEVAHDVLMYKDEGLENGVSYTYYVTAVNPFGESSPSWSVDAVPASVPEAPAALSLVAGVGGINITWTPSSSDGGSPILGYILMRKVGGEEFVEISQLGPGLTYFADSDVLPGTEYSYLVKARNRMGESRDSEKVTEIAVGLPGCPVDVTIVTGDGYNVLHWSCPLNTGGCDLVGFRLYRIDRDSTEAIMAQELLPSEDNYNDSGLENGMEYGYYLTAVNQYGESGSSELVAGVPVGVPNATTNLVAVATGHKVKLTWNAPNDDGGCCVLHYLIMRSIDGGKWARISLVDSGELTYTDHEEKEPGTYTYTVIPVNDVGPASCCQEAAVEVKESRTKSSFVEDQMGLVVTIPIILVLLVLIAALLARRVKNEEEAEPAPSPVEADDGMNGYQDPVEGPIEGYDHADPGQGIPTYGQEYEQ